MRDVLEERLAARLRDLGDLTPVELEPPADLNLRVRRRKRRTRVATRWVGLSIAAVTIIGVTTAALLQGAARRPGVDVAVHPPAPAPHDALPEGTMLLAAKGRDVVALDATGYTLATMIHAQRGAIQYVQVTADHRWLWYLSRKGSGACADVVRADIDARTSKIITRAAGFAISPDGKRLALFGSGDVAHDECVAPSAGRPTRVVVEDVATGQTSSLAGATDVTGLQWSPDGSYLIALSCHPWCIPLQRIDVPSNLRLPLLLRNRWFDPAARSSSAAFGADGLYVLQPSASGQAVATYDPGTLELADIRLAIDARWHVSQVAPTDTTTFVVAAYGRQERPALYEIDASRHLRLLRSADPGVLTPVFPLPAAG